MRAGPCYRGTASHGGRVTNDHHVTSIAIIGLVYHARGTSRQPCCLLYSSIAQGFAYIPADMDI